jgi:phage terminase small subunit
MKDANATKAAIRAGYSKNEASAGTIGSRLLQKVEIQAAIEEAQERAAAKLDVDLGEWLENVKELAFAPGHRDSARHQGQRILGQFKKWLTDKVEHTGGGGGAIQVQILMPGKDQPVALPPKEGT